VRPGAQGVVMSGAPGVGAHGRSGRVALVREAWPGAAPESLHGGDRGSHVGERLVNHRVGWLCRRLTFRQVIGVFE
jgi:hypothetical protein